MRRRRDPRGPAPVPPFARAVTAVVVLAVVSALLQILFVRPYLWPAGAGAQLRGDPTVVLPLKARPPDVASAFTSPPEIFNLASGSPAAAEAIADRSVLIEQIRDGAASGARFDAERLATPEVTMDSRTLLIALGIVGVMACGNSEPVPEAPSRTTATEAMEAALVTALIEVFTELQ